MNPAEQTDPAGQETALRARLRMAYFLLLLFIIHILEAYVTFPFVDHTTKAQNVLYGFIVAAPFYTISIIFIVLTRRDLVTVRKEIR